MTRATTLATAITNAGQLRLRMLGQHRLPLGVRSEPKQKRQRYGRVGDEGTLGMAGRFGLVDASGVAGDNRRVDDAVTAA